MIVQNIFNSSDYIQDRSSCAPHCLFLILECIPHMGATSWFQTQSQYFIHKQTVKISQVCISLMPMPRKVWGMQMRNVIDDNVLRSAHPSSLLQITCLNPNKDCGVLSIEIPQNGSRTRQTSEDHILDNMNLQQ